MSYVKLRRNEKVDEAIVIWAKENKRPVPWCDGQYNHYLDENESAILIIMRRRDD